MDESKLLNMMQDLIDEVENRDIKKRMQDAIDDCWGFIFNGEGDQK